MKKALVTGITGQDGSYLAELLLEKGYEVHGMVRRASTESFERIHRSNLVGMGVLPLQFKDGETRETYGIDGTETFDIAVPDDLQPRQPIEVTARAADGSTKSVDVSARVVAALDESQIDTLVVIGGEGTLEIGMRCLVLRNVVLLLELLQICVIRRL